MKAWQKMKTKHIKLSKKRIIIISGVLLIAVLAGLGIWYRFYSPDTEIRRIYEQNLEAELPPSALDPSLQIQINQHLNKGEFPEAKKLILQGLDNDGLTAQDKTALNSALAIACNSTKDLPCMEDVINFQKSTDTVDVFLVIDAATVAANKNQTQQADTLYKLALETIDKRGGADYIEQLNKDTQRQLDYEDIKSKAG